MKDGAFGNGRTWTTAFALSIGKGLISIANCYFTDEYGDN